jgi:hypothetical protein
MDLNTGRPDHLEDYLVSHKTGQWFGWVKNGKNNNARENQIYANLVIHDGSTKPTEKECTDGLKALQDAFDAKDYARKRSAEYPRLVDQMDLIYHSGIDAWKAKIKETKDKYPKP